MIKSRKFPENRLNTKIKAEREKKIRESIYKGIASTKQV